MTPMVMKSFAKINLGLKIKGKRPDGFHELETVFKRVDLTDEVILEPLSGIDIQLTCSRPDLPCDGTNLCYRAAEKMQELAGEKFGIRIHVEKKIPIGGGLGGGSSNAAAVMVGIQNLLQLNIDGAKLIRAGAELGSDVPFFVASYLGMGNTATGSGRGEVLDFFEWPLLEKVVLVNPGIPIDTGWAYKNYARKCASDADLQGSFSLTNRVESIKFSALLAKPLFFGNYFEPLVFETYPKIKMIRDELEKKGAKLARLSGSGATVFGIFEENADLRQWPALFQDCFVHVGRFV
jgi:4-diphosphocytidyl-2-C-methyl-D-erythritol kinase